MSDPINEALRPHTRQMGLPDAPYTSDIFATWVLVEHLRSKYHDISLISVGGGLWQCRVTWGHSGEAKTAPMAVALAVLALMGGELPL